MLPPSGETKIVKKHWLMLYMFIRRMIMKRKNVLRFTAVICAVITMVAFFSCKKSKDTDVFKIGFANNSDSHLFDKLKRDEFERLAESDPSIKVVFTNASDDMQLQLDHIDNFIAQKMDAIIVMPIDADGIIPGIERANKAKIPIIAQGSNAGGGDFIFIGTEYYQDGVKQAEYLSEHLSQNANIVYLICIPGQIHTRERKAGLVDTFNKARSDITFLAEQTGRDDKALGMQIMEDWIQTFPKIDAVIAQNDMMALGAIEALKGANRLSGVLVAGVDAVPEALTSIKNREMSVSVFQSAKGIAQGCYDVVKGLQRNETVEKRIIIPNETVTIDNVDQFF
jgi:inositol transport system substrate-binding protein